MRDDDPRPVCEECCLLVLKLVSSTLSCIRQPRPRCSVDSQKAMILVLSVFMSMRLRSLQSWQTVII